MFKNFWYGLEFSERITDKPVKVKCLGQQLVLYRKRDGSVVCMSDLCVHRGAALSGGTVKDDCVVCPYHGWQYGSDGAVVKIPAHPERGIPRKARVDAYPTQEQYGMVWAFLGDLPEEERPPIPPFPEFEDPEYRAVTGEFLWNSNYERIVENGCDIAHTPFVHAGRFGNPEHPEVPDFDLETTPWSSAATVSLKPPRPRGLWSMMNPSKADLTDRPDVMVEPMWHLPNIVKLTITLPLGKLVLFDVNIPIDENTTLVKFISLRTFFKKKMFDRDARRRVIEVIKQDRDVVDTVRPELLPFDLSAELQVRSDLNQVHYRRRRQELIDLGWHISGSTIVGDDSAPRSEATVIPSPARREHPELASAWNFKEVSSRETLDSEGRLVKGHARGRASDQEVLETTYDESAEKAGDEQEVSA